jgi:putative addiction module killer protein
MNPSGTFTLRYYTARNGKDYYNEWLSGLDDRTRARVLRQVEKLERGIGYQKPLDNKLWELVIEEGPGYRVYFTKDGDKIIVVLAGSDKSGQKRTIALARRLIREIEEDRTLRERRN